MFSNSKSKWNTMMGWFSNFDSSPLFNHIEQEEHKISACVRLGNPDLDFKNRIRILHSNAKSENGFHLREIRLQGGFQLRNPNADFMDFLFTVWKRICKTVLVNSGLLFNNYACACNASVLKDSFTNPFSDFSNGTVKLKIQKQIYQCWNPFWLEIRNPDFKI